MRKSVQFILDDPDGFVDQLLNFSNNIESFCLLNNNGFSSQNKVINEIPELQSFDYLIGIDELEGLKLNAEKGAFELLRDFSQSHEDWLMGAFSYDLKNDLEDLNSANFDSLDFPALYFFVPRWVLLIKKNELTIFYTDEYTLSEVYRLKEDIEGAEIDKQVNQPDISVLARVSKDEYLERIAKVKDYIQRGDIYEMNFCQEFYAENTVINPVKLYQNLNKKSPAPFSNFFKIDGNYIISASPERYIRKIGRKLYTQPMKGTTARGLNKEEDERLRDALKDNVKEQSENVMIVDLCRNDLSRVAARGSVNVDELFGVYTFPQVHQLISTVSAELKNNFDFLDAIQCSFPMGSMTGAPKIRAMQIIEDLELSKRGMFSGAVGYITPERDFDFNVLIRSILYNSQKGYLSFTVGGAITILSDPVQEYKECLLKARAMMEVLKNQVENYG